MNIENIAEAVLYVDDLPAATRFYQDVLKLPLSYSFADASFLQTGERSTLILFDRARLLRRQSAIPHHGADGPGHVAFAVPHESMEAWRQQLAEQGIAVEHEQSWPQGTHSLYFRDPAGNSVELIDGRHYPRVWEWLSGAS
jgi:catechol 2,3-dioxygenase-like lactoylglutathione lyase family enzyme